MIYAVECGGRIKIGYSTKPYFRFNKIASDAPFPCTFLGQWDGSREDEAALHERFSGHRCYREWFAASVDVREYIAAHATTVDLPSERFAISENDSPLAAWRKSQRLTMDGPAAEIGITVSCWWRWENKPARVPFSKINKVFQLTGIPRRDLCDPKWAHLFDDYVEARAA